MNTLCNYKKFYSIKFILNKISIFVKNNFDVIRLIVKGKGHKAFSYLKELKKKIQDLLRSR